MVTVKKERLVCAFLLILIFCCCFSFVSAAEPKAINGTYLVEYGSTIELNGDVTIKSSNNKIAQVSGNNVRIVGCGKFTLTADSNGNTKNYNLFSWNAHLKKGKYATYVNSNRKKSSSSLKAETYLAVSNVGKALRVDDYLFGKGGSYKGSLTGMYLTSYYGKNTKDYEYSMNANSKVYSFDIISEVNVSNKEYTLTTNLGPNGMISPSGRIVVNEGENKTFTITPDSGYGIKNIMINGKTQKIQQNINLENINKDIIIEVEFSNNIESIDDGEVENQFLNCASDVMNLLKKKGVKYNGKYSGKKVNDILYVLAVCSKYGMSGSASSSISTWYKQAYNLFKGKSTASWMKDNFEVVKVSSSSSKGFDKGYVDELRSIIKPGDILVHTANKTKHIEIVSAINKINSGDQIDINLYSFEKNNTTYGTISKTYDFGSGRGFRSVTAILRVKDNITNNIDIGSEGDVNVPQNNSGDAQTKFLEYASNCIKWLHYYNFGYGSRFHIPPYKSTTNNVPRSFSSKDRSLDCVAYVEWVCYEYGLKNNLSALKKTTSTIPKWYKQAKKWANRDSSTESWMKCFDVVYVSSSTKNFENGVGMVQDGWTADKIRNTLRPGDILVYTTPYKNHIDIYAGIDTDKDKGLDYEVRIKRYSAGENVKDKNEYANGEPISTQYLLSEGNGFWNCTAVLRLKSK